jgi:L-fuculose-phosphate aldolase
MLLKEERERIVHFGQKLVNANLTTGTGGNLSIASRKENLAAISPSGIDYFQMRPEDVTVVNMAGKIQDGKCKPSSELGFHLALYSTRTDVQAVVHTHSVYATTIACLHWELPAVHYLVGLSGNKVPLAPYATYGTVELARNVADSIGTYNAVLLANHGLVTVGVNMDMAYAVAEEIELVARIYYQARNLGQPVVLPDEEMEVVMKKFKKYGQ